MRPPTPTQFARLFSKGFKTPPHVLHLEKIFLQMLKGKLPPRALIELPVRHGKSRFCSEVLPAWHMCCFPDKEIILSGYGAAFSAEWGAKARNLFSLAAPSYGLQLNEQRSDHWSVLHHRGVCNTAGTNSPVSGRGASLLVADDLVKDQREAESPTYRESTWRWVMGDLLTRLEPDGIALFVLSRRHPEDVVGKIHQLMEAGGAPWNVIRLPALAEENDPLGRQPGTPLWPDRFDHAALLKIKQDLELSGEGYLWDSLYQQDPQGDPAGREWPESYFRGILYDEMPPDLTPVCSVVSVDPSKGSDSKSGDPAAILSVHLDTRGHLWVEDGVIRSMPTDQIEDTALGMMVAGVSGCIVESNHFQEMIATNMMRKRPGAPVYKHVSTTNKEVRIRVSLTPLLAQHRIHIKNRPFGQILLAQLRSFPTATHDDGPDSLDMAKKLFDQLTAQKRPAQQRKVLQVR